MVLFISNAVLKAVKYIHFFYFKNSLYSIDKKHEITKIKDSKNATDTTTVSDETLKEEPIAKESVEENELKIETATETSAGPKYLDNTKETISKQQIKTIDEQNSENKDEDDDRTDDRNPEFETAPNCSIDEHQEDHTQVCFNLILFYMVYPFSYSVI